MTNTLKEKSSCACRGEGRAKTLKANGSSAPSSISSIPGNMEFMGNVVSDFNLPYLIMFMIFNPPPQ